MCVTQKLKLYNGGNAPAEIFWDNNKEKAFSVSPKKDIILPQTEKAATFIFNPFNSLIQKEKYPDEFKLNIINGEPMTFPVEGIVSTCYVNFSGDGGDTVNFDLVHTGVPATKIFSLRNDSVRIVSAYQIQNPLPEILFIQLTGLAASYNASISVVVKLTANLLTRFNVPLATPAGAHHFADTSDFA